MLRSDTDYLIDNSCSIKLAKLYLIIVSVFVHDSQSVSQSDRQTVRQTDRQTDRQSVSQTDIQLDRQTDRPTVSQTDRHTDIQSVNLSLCICPVFEFVAFDYLLLFMSVCAVRSVCPFVTGCRHSINNPSGFSAKSAVKSKIQKKIPVVTKWQSFF